MHRSFWMSQRRNSWEKNKESSTFATFLYLVNSVEVFATDKGSFYQIYHNQPIFQKTGNAKSENQRIINIIKFFKVFSHASDI